MTNPNKTVYKTYPTTGRGTINTGTTLNANFGTQRVAVNGYVQNFDQQGNDLLIKLNSASNDLIVVKCGTSFVFKNEYIDKIYLTNDSGAAIEYQVVLVGA